MTLASRGTYRGSERRTRNSMNTFCRHALANAVQTTRRQRVERALIECALELTRLELGVSPAPEDEQAVAALKAGESVLALRFGASGVEVEILPHTGTTS